MEYDEMIEESVEESVEEESSEETVKEESSEELVEEEPSEESVVVDYDRLEQIVFDNSYKSTQYDTDLNDLPVSDVVLLVVALILGILCIKGRN